MLAGKDKVEILVNVQTSIYTAGSNVSQIWDQIGVVANAGNLWVDLGAIHVLKYE